MKNIQSEIEQSMVLLLNGDVDKTLQRTSAINHLSKASNLLKNAGMHSFSSKIQDIMKKANTIDESEIEVEL